MEVPVSVSFWEKWWQFIVGIFNFFISLNTPEAVTLIALLAAGLHLVPRAFGKRSLLVLMFTPPKGGTSALVQELTRTVSSIAGKMEKFQYVLGEWRSRPSGIKHATLVEICVDILEKVNHLQKHSPDGKNDALVEVSEKLSVIKTRQEQESSDRQATATDVQNVYAILTQVKDEIREVKSGMVANEKTVERLATEMRFFAAGKCPPTQTVKTVEVEKE